MQTRCSEFLLQLNVRRLFVAAILTLATGRCLRAEVTVTVERSATGSGFRFKSVPAPANNDAATTARFKLIDGERDRNGGDLDVLHDGQVPEEEDQPSQNFFFRAGTDGGRLALDLGGVIAVKRVSTYSWHPGPRGPQVYKMYAADGNANGFNAEPRRGTDPTSCGWKLIATVDTRPKAGNDEGGGQYGVAISDSEAGAFGNFRYLLFDVTRTEDHDAFGNTFYSEIDVIDANGPAPATGVASERKSISKSFDAEGGKYQFTINATEAPDLMDWADRELRPVVQEWYPKLIAMLPGDGFTPATNITLRFRKSMGGTPASAGGGGVNLNSEWFRRELNGEARGSVVHELVHIVQDYGRARRTNPEATRTPGWLVEGIADYIRWFLFEPQTKGAEITERNLPRARYDASYRITANFLNWVTLNHDKMIVPKLNAAAREGKYSEQLWKDWTGKSVTELGEAWRKENETRINAAKSELLKGGADTN
ncbi:MAG TPA: basic secretory protein-like protein [Candidatus Nitrosotalea sp.]|nr:basic secretory protein-like protein [Candidatus Nitrosotalea sp.]